MSMGVIVVGAVGLATSVAASDPGRVAREYVEAVGEKRFDRVAALLHPDVDFTGPDGKTMHGAEPYVAVLERLAPILARNEVRKVFVDGDEACVLYDFVTDTPVGAVPSTEWLRVEGGRVRSIRLVFHTAAWPRVLEELKARLRANEPPATATYLAVYRRGPAWRLDRPIGEQGLSVHDEYLRGLLAKGVLQLGGPFVDGSGGASLVEAASESDATAMIEADPSVAAGVLAYELHRWHMPLRSLEPRR